MTLYDDTKVKAIYIRQKDGTDKKFVPEKHGVWVEEWCNKALGVGMMACSECKHSVMIEPLNYCPHCGARMDSALPYYGGILKVDDLSKLKGVDE